MDIGALFLLLILVTLVALFVFSPLRRSNSAQAGAGQLISELLAERDRILKEIQELDFDNSLAKIPPEEYTAQRKVLLQSGAEMLRRLDEQSRSSPVPVSSPEGAATAALEAVIAGPDFSVSDEDLEELIARRRTARKEKTGGFCPKCGKPFLQSDKFCSCCGEPVGLSS
jgi:hypothetical protein